MSKIVLTLQEAFQLWPALDELVIGPIEDGVRLPAKEMPAKASYRLGKIYRKLQPDIEAYEKTRIDLFKRLGTHDEETDNWTIKEENMDDFTLEMEVLQEENITLEGVMKIEFGDISHLEFKAASILALEPLMNNVE